MFKQSTFKGISDKRFKFVPRQSQMGKLGREALSPQELASFQDSICSLAASERDLVADDSLDADTVSQLLSQHVQGMLGEGSLADSSQGTILLFPWLLGRNCITVAIITTTIIIIIKLIMCHHHHSHFIKGTPIGTYELSELPKKWLQRGFLTGGPI